MCTPRSSLGPSCLYAPTLRKFVRKDRRELNWRAFGTGRYSKTKQDTGFALGSSYAVHRANPASSGGTLNWSLNTDSIFLVRQTIPDHFRLGTTVYSNSWSAARAGFALGKSDTWSPGTCFSSRWMSCCRNQCRANELTVFYLAQMPQHVFS